MAKTERTNKARQRGLTLLEVLMSAALILVAAMAAVMYVTRGSHHAEWTREKVFARQKALSLLGELRAFVEGGEGEVAADLDGFDDGTDVEASLTITPDPNEPGAYLPPQHPLSGNVTERNLWKWYRRITVRRFPGVETRDLRICTVRVFRMYHGDLFPGEQMAEVSSVIRTIGDAYPTTQVYDVYLLALESVPGWWVFMDAIQPFIEATLSDLESRNPGLDFRVHWISKSGYGRDEEYAPYTNEKRVSTDATPWAYVYPGRMPDGLAAARYYVPHRFGSRMNVDGALAPAFVNEVELQEPYIDTNGNGRRDAGEPYTDDDGDGKWDEGNPYPYAVADMHNHCKRWPDANAHFQARIAAGVDDDSAPTWRLLLDRMIAEPDRYHNAIVINLHGELLPMPPARNYSDAAKRPTLKPGWRAVSHPERLRPARVAGDDAASDTPRFRVYAYKTEFTNTETWMTQEEPYQDTDGSGSYDVGEPYADTNGSGAWDAEMPISFVVRDGDFSKAPNDGANPSIIIRRLQGGVDADDDSNLDAYVDWNDAPLLPEEYTDTNGDGRRQVAETYFDLDGNGTKDAYDPHQDLDGDATWTETTEALVDGDGDSELDLAQPAEPYTDTNSNGKWDAAEPYWDVDKDGSWTAADPATAVLPWVPWDPANYGNALATAQYVAWYGEPFLDMDGDDSYDDQETFFDADQDGVRDAGFEPGEMWTEVRYDAIGKQTVVTLHGTPLVTPETGDGRGLDSDWRLYDLEYVPCPTPSSATGTDRFSRDLYSTGDDPKNTARWIIELPLASVRRAFESGLGSNDGDVNDRIITAETRIGTDLSTGVMWPVRSEPQNLSRTYAYFYGDTNDVPYSERYQWNGDPRHSPYADTDRTGTTAVHGYNWYFDNFQTSGDERDEWLAFDSARLRNRWKGRGSVDVARLTSWLRAAIVQTEAVYTTLTGFSYYYMSIGGDIGYDAANGFPNSIPMDGTPFGISGKVYENTIIPLGTAAIRGSLKYVRSNDGAAAGVRSGGYWWSKPWIGELFQDAAYETQWKPLGNLQAATGTGALRYRQFKRGDVTGSQLPDGTDLYDSYSRLAAEGCTSVFNIGSSGSTFHHQYKDGQSGQLIEDGPQLSANYNFPMPSVAWISRPFALNVSTSGGIGDEFNYTDAYPRYSASMVRRFYDHASGATGCGLVRLDDPTNTRSGFIVVNGLDKTSESGSAFISRYSLLSLIHSFLAGGAPGGTHPIRQLPRVQIRHPTLITDLNDPDEIDVVWSTEALRWDGLPYTDSYPVGYSADEAALLYVLMYSKDGGKQWLNAIDDSVATPGVMPYLDGVGPDPARTLTDSSLGGNETFKWLTPAAKFPEGSVMLRIEAYRASETLHYAHHVEKIYVNR